MRWRTLGMLAFLAFLVLMPACSAVEKVKDRLGPESPGPIDVGEHHTLVYSAVMSNATAPGDTLVYPLTWGAAARATGYRITVTATGTGWTGLPSNFQVTTPSYQLRAINTTTWDSTTFTATVYAYNAVKQNNTPATTTWKAQRGPGSPGPILVDSSLIQLSMFFKPDNVKLEYGGAVQFCAFFLGLDNVIRMAEGQNTIAQCKQWYDAFPPSQTLPGYPVALQPKAMYILHPEVRLAKNGDHMEVRPFLRYASGP